MKYDYPIKHNGIYYPAGVDVPTNDKPTVEKSAVGDKVEPQVEKEVVKPTKKSTKKA